MRGNHTIGIVLANDQSAVVRITTDSPFSRSDHNSVNLDLLFETGTKLTCDQLSNHVRGGRRITVLWIVTYLPMMGPFVFVQLKRWRHMGSIRRGLDNAISLFESVAKCRANWTTRGRIGRYPSLIRILAARKQCLWRRLRQEPDSITLV